MPYTIAVIGTGYVGLVSGTCFAENGNQVICVDNDPRKLAKLNNGQIPIYEPGLHPLYERNFRDGRLRFTDDLAEATLKSDIIFLCLPTPPQEDGSADLQYVLKVADEIGGILAAHAPQPFKIIVDKSTVPIGTSERVTEVIRARYDGEFTVASNPEFLREGFAVEDSLRPDRVVIGTSHPVATKVLTDLYEPFVLSGNPIIVMDERSAEITKYAANSHLAMRISFMNDLANLCEILDANIDNVRRGIGTDSRIGKKFLFAGTGYGGSCFPKDVKALLKTSIDAQHTLRIVQAVEDVNADQPKRFFKKVYDYFDGDLKGKTFAMWGLAFKPNTDDTREAPAFIIIDHLLDAGATVQAFDPEAMENTRELRFGDRITYAENAYAALDNADALLLVTEWNEFRMPDWNKIKSALNIPVVFDGRNIYDMAEMEELGFDYFSIGRPVVRGRK
ncbi:MAG: UDP-glucose/GDP-mannose dehydrogenase family protein [Bacteroidota bacterium]|jgi:UDPglucose 6-dehydrogenase|nr:UDP-glucose/GDP-mannose dehydrogenase family protein [Bacteroidota bacterium]